MHNCPNPNDLDVSLFLLAMLVIVVLRAIWWIEDRNERRKLRALELVDRAYQTPAQRAQNEAELRRWLYEGEG